MAKTIDYEEAEELRRRFIDWGREQGYIGATDQFVQVGPLTLYVFVHASRKRRGYGGMGTDRNDSYVELKRDVPWEEKNKTWRYRDLKSLQRATNREITAVDKRMIAEDERKMDAAIEVFTLGWCAAREGRELRCRDNDGAHPFLAKITDKDGSNPQWIQVIYNEELDTLTSSIVMGDPTNSSNRIAGRLTLHNVEVLYRSGVLID